MVADNPAPLYTLADIAAEPDGLESIREVIVELRRLHYDEEANLMENELHKHGLSIPPGLSHEDKRHLEGPPTEAELRAMAADQQRPEFLAWLADMDRELNLFFAEDIPDLPHDPYTMDGLRWIERFTLDFFWAKDYSRDWSQLSDRVARYFGEFLVRTVEGEWQYIDVDGDGLAPVIHTPNDIGWYGPERAVQHAMARRTGEVLPLMYDRLVEAHSSWVKHGRMPLLEWVDFESEQRRGLR